MKRKGKNGDGNLKTWGFAAGAAALLAILTLVLCIMGGVFDFVPHTTPTEAPAVTPSYVPAAVTTTAPEVTPRTTVPPTATPTPTEAPVPYYISAIAGTGGSLSPSGLVQAETGGSVTFVALPDDGYVLAELKVDGSDVDISSGSYTFTDIEADHTIYAVFQAEAPATPSPTPTPDTGDIPVSATDLG